MDLACGRGYLAVVVSLTLSKLVSVMLALSDPKTWHVNTAANCLVVVHGTVWFLT